MIQRDEINAQADAIAALINASPDSIMFDRHGVTLTVEQAKALIMLAQGTDE